MASYRVGVDVGGTFTDIVLLGSDGTIHTKKISSSAANYAQAIVDGHAEVFHETGLAGGEIEEIRHGTTVASNAILEHKGARTGLITTKGFRDVLEIRTLRMPRLYDIGWTKPPPLVERYLRQVVDERVTAAGAVGGRSIAQTPSAVDAAGREGRSDRRVPAALIRESAHKLLIREVIAAKRRASLLALLRSAARDQEYEPVDDRHQRLRDAGRRRTEGTAQSDETGIGARVLLMQSNGGLTTDAAAAERPIRIIESGPRAASSARRRSRGRRISEDHHVRHGRHDGEASIVERASRALPSTRSAPNRSARAC